MCCKFPSLLSGRLHTHALKTACFNVGRKQFQLGDEHKSQVHGLVHAVHRLHGHQHNRLQRLFVLLVTTAIIVIIIRPCSRPPYAAALCHTLCHNMSRHVISAIFVTPCCYAYCLPHVQDLPLDVVYEDDHVLVVNKVTPPAVIHIPCFDLSPATSYLIMSSHSHCVPVHCTASLHIMLAFLTAVHAAASLMVAYSVHSMGYA